MADVRRRERTLPDQQDALDRVRELEDALRRAQEHADVQQQRAEAMEQALRRAYQMTLSRRTRED